MTILEKIIYIMTKKSSEKRQEILPLTYEKDGMLFFYENSEKSRNENDFLIINPEKINQTIKYINKKKILAISINNSYFKTLENLDFLKYVPDVETVVINQNTINISGLSFLKKIRTLSFNKCEPKINLELFPELEFLSGDYRNLYNLNKNKQLKNIALDFYNKEDLSELKEMVNLEEIFFYRTNIKSFKGIENCRNLKKIDIYNAPRLETLNGIPENAKDLEILFIYNARLLTDYENLKTQRKIKRLQLVSGGELDDLEIFENMKELQFVGLGMKIKNGDKSEFMNKINAK